MRLYEKAPHPFVFEDRAVDSDQSSVDLILFGKAVAYFPFFRAALEKLGESGIGKFRSKFEIEEVRGEGSHTLEIPASLTSDEGDRVDTVRLQTVSPLSIKSDGKVAKTIDFKLLVSSILRRLELISYFHIGNKLELDRDAILSLAEKVECVGNELKSASRGRFSRRQGRVMLLEGLTGNATFRGPIQMFSNMLRIAEVMHVGRHTSFGLGRVRFFINEPLVTIY
ncbi:MAG: CRISPR system precrRNA processing endoribonuclease RAMP protein Cas6 [Planctomycetes bacterium]|nr:CRISPR system precrRNA processing endoribonuclease RAMP protein Cas6 [Planctomycetota bacterium]